MKVASLALIFAATAALLCNPAVRAADDAALKEPAKSVLNHYLTIQTNLAGDSLQGLAEHAKAIASAVKGDTAKMLPSGLVAQAETLAQAKDLKAARAAFKPLSASLVKYLADKKAGQGVYHEVYCPMADANWLQTGKDIRNPYFGKEMLDCGEMKN